VHYHAYAWLSYYSHNPHFNNTYPVLVMPHLLQPVWLSCLRGNLKHILVIVSLQLLELCHVTWKAGPVVNMSKFFCIWFCTTSAHHFKSWQQQKLHKYNKIIMHNIKENVRILHHWLTFSRVWMCLRRYQGTKVGLYFKRKKTLIWKYELKHDLKSAS